MSTESHLKLLETKNLAKAILHFDLVRDAASFGPCPACHRATDCMASPLNASCVWFYCSQCHFAGDFNTAIQLVQSGQAEPVEPINTSWDPDPDWDAANDSDPNVLALSTSEVKRLLPRDCFPVTRHDAFGNPAAYAILARVQDAPGRFAGFVDLAGGYVPPQYANPGIVLLSNFVIGPDRPSKFKYLFADPLKAVRFHLHFAKSLGYAPAVAGNVGLTNTLVKSFGRAAESYIVWDNDRHKSIKLASLSNSRVAMWRPSPRELKDFHDKPAMTLERMQKSAVTWPEALSQILPNTINTEGLAAYLQLSPDKIECLARRTRIKLRNTDGWRHMLLRRYPFRGDYVVEKNGQWRMELGQEVVSSVAIRLLEVQTYAGVTTWGVSVRHRRLEHVFKFEYLNDGRALTNLQELFKARTGKPFQMQSKIWNHFENILFALSNPVIK